MNSNTLKTSWRIAAASGLAMALTFIDQTAVNVALPSIQKNLQISTNLLHWVINAYLLTLAMFLVLGGKLGDRHGNKNIFTIGIFLFALASLCSAISINGITLILSRALQGIGSALMIPNASALVINAFPDNMRGKVMGTLLSFTSIFLILGPLFGGFFSEYISWHYIFWINLPICLISIFLIIKYAPRTVNNIKNKIDWLGFGLMSGWIFSLVFSLMQVGNYGWQSLFILSLLSLAAIFFILFILHGKKQNAFISLQFFQNKTFNFAVFLYTGIQIVFMLNVFLPIYSQRILGFSPFIAGLLAAPSIMPVLLLARFSGRLRDTYGPRRPIVIGFLFLLSGSLWLCFAFWSYNIYLILLGSMCFSAAAPFIFGNANTTALSVIQPENRGIAAGISSCCRQLGGSISMAVLGSLITYITSMAATHFIHSHIALHHEINLEQVLGFLSDSKKALQTIQHLSGTKHAMLIQTSHYAYTVALTTAGILTALISAICFFVALRLPTSNEGS